MEIKGKAMNCRFLFVARKSCVQKVSPGISIATDHGRSDLEMELFDHRHGPRGRDGDLQHLI